MNAANDTENIEVFKFKMIEKQFPQEISESDTHLYKHPKQGNSNDGDQLFQIEYK